MHHINDFSKNTNEPCYNLLLLGIGWNKREGKLFSIEWCIVHTHYIYYSSRSTLWLVLFDIVVGLSVTHMTAVCAGSSPASKTLADKILSSLKHNYIQISVMTMFTEWYFVKGLRDCGWIIPRKVSAMRSLTSLMFSDDLRGCKQRNCRWFETIWGLYDVDRWSFCRLSFVDNDLYTN